MEVLVSREIEVAEEDLSLVRRCLEAVWKKEELPEEGEVSVLFVDDETIRAINREHRGVDNITDVLSFPQVGSSEEARAEHYLVLGDIVINLARCREQALRFGHSVQREIAYLTIHSFYHLLGYDHEDPSSYARMRKKEESAYAFFLEER